MRVRIDLAYDGAGFAGWAKQPGLQTVQGALEAAHVSLELPVGVVVGRGEGKGDEFARGCGDAWVGADAVAPAFLHQFAHDAGNALVLRVAAHLISSRCARVSLAPGTSTPALMAALMALLSTSQEGGGGGTSRM